MHPNLANQGQAFLLVVDLQEGYRDKLHEWDRTIAKSIILIRAAKLLELPIFCTEQYPRGLGHTAPEVVEALSGARVYEKRTLSVLGASGLAEDLLATGRRHAIVCGIETHACVNNTVHDLLAWGMTVHLPKDALSSRNVSDHELGFQKMLGSGAQGGSVESVLLECLRTADHPAFKPVQGLLK